MSGPPVHRYFKGPHLGRILPVKAGIEQAIARGLAYAPYADLLWCETGKPDLEEAKHFAEGIRKKFPGKLLAYNCSPSFNWKRKLDDASIAKFQRELERWATSSSSSRSRASMRSTTPCSSSRVGTRPSR